ncbi:VOC family protein [Gemmatimonas sp.]|jgi:catechol 2,3-dioxygenase-like lactoylglutathione lyase family enzyme|uniref:VOC family protein n=1 Tax=Gemmatimonas sp. TaxID=1962908 RepID=UPI0037C082FB
MSQFVSIVPVLRVADLPRSVAWYRENLGFTADTDDVDASRESCVIRRDATELMLRRAPSPVARARDSYLWDVYIRLAGEALTALLDHARRRTPLVRGPELMPSGAVEFELEDPDGYRVCVAEVLSDTRGFPRAVG